MSEDFKTFMTYAIALLIIFSAYFFIIELTEKPREEVDIYRYDEEMKYELLEIFNHELVFYFAERSGVDCTNKTWQECAWNEGEGLHYPKEEKQE